MTHQVVKNVCGPAIMRGRSYCTILEVLTRLEGGERLDDFGGASRMGGASVVSRIYLFPTEVRLCASRNGDIPVQLPADVVGQGGES